MLQISKIVLGFLRTNCYIIANENNELIVIDPAQDYPKIRPLLGNKKVLAVLLTHGHFDHIGAVNDFVKEYGCPIYCHYKDQELVANAKLNGSLIYSRTPVEVKEGITYFKDSFTIPNFNIKIIQTPGHSPGSTSYLFDNQYLFSGDFLFKGCLGRTDFYKSSEESMKLSCKLIAKYDPAIVVYPGHDGETTLKEELENNEYLKNYL